MRKKSHQGELKALAVAGSHVVLLGWDLDAAKLKAGKVIGFGIQRKRKSDGEVIWMSGLKTLESVEPHPAPGVPVSTFKHPIQSFQWADYSVEPDEEYTYRIVARCNTGTGLAALQDGVDASLHVKTESTTKGKHSVFFNRGALASQEYARRFLNKRPSDYGQPAYDWLSRGLIEGLLAFIDQAGQGDELYGAFFEFKNRHVFDHLVAATQRGATVKVLYDGDSERERNENAIFAHPIKPFTKARVHSAQFAHNKFFVLRQNGVSKQVWTGSTNLSENGVYGHSNNAHVVRDEGVAAKYYDYWKILDDDKTLAPTSTKTEALIDVPPPNWTDETIAIFSPRKETDALDWYATLAGGADRAMFATFAFGIDERFINVYDKQHDSVLRFALLERKGNGKNYAIQAEQVEAVRRRPNTVVAVGNHVKLNNFDRWLEEIDRIKDEVNVRFIHTKYMLIDPLGNKPKVIVGSANFSRSSSVTNDENMLVIQDNDDLADIYLGEFMRLYSHYAFRETLTFKDNQEPEAAPRRKYLRADTSWIDGEPGKPQSSYYANGTDRTLRRVYFSGQ